MKQWIYKGTVRTTVTGGGRPKTDPEDFVADLDEVADLAAAVNDIRREGGRAIYVVADVADYQVTIDGPQGVSVFTPVEASSLTNKDGRTTATFSACRSTARGSARPGR